MCDRTELIEDCIYTYFTHFSKLLRYHETAVLKYILPKLSTVSIDLFIQRAKIAQTDIKNHNMKNVTNDQLLRSTPLLIKNQNEIERY